MHLVYGSCSPRVAEFTTSDVDLTTGLDRTRGFTVATVRATSAIRSNAPETNGRCLYAPPRVHVNTCIFQLRRDSETWFCGMQERPRISAVNPFAKRFLIVTFCARTRPEVDRSPRLEELRTNFSSNRASVIVQRFRNF